jgi:hypothetical protein
MSLCHIFLIYILELLATEEIFQSIYSHLNSDGYIFQCDRNVVRMLHSSTTNHITGSTSALKMII